MGPAVRTRLISFRRGPCKENQERTPAEYIVNSGMRDADYQYVNIDDCWLTHQRDAEGRLVPDPTKFPDGIGALPTIPIRWV